MLHGWRAHGNAACQTKGTSTKASLSKALGLLSLVLAAAACQKPPELTREIVRAEIEAAPAFHSPFAADVAMADARVKDNPNLKRQVLGVEGVVVKPDGPFGMAGATATASFTWTWTGGPLAGQKYKTLAKLHSSGGPWKVYDDELERQLQAAMRGDE
jgi:hypothetical protein